MNGILGNFTQTLNLLDFIYTIGAAIIGAIIGRIANRKKQFFCYKETNSIIKAGKSLIPKLELKYDNKEIEELKITKIIIWNKSKQVIHGNDIVDERPLRIICDNNEALILDVIKIAESDETSKFCVEKKDDTNAIIKFAFVESNKGVALQVLHTGTEENLKVDYKIIGGKEVKYINTVQRKVKDSRLIYYLGIILIILSIIIALGVAVGLFLDILINNKVMARTLIDIALFGVYIYMCVHFLKIILCDIYHLNIPVSLRDAVKNNVY